MNTEDTGYVRVLCLQVERDCQHGVDACSWRAEGFVLLQGDNSELVPSLSTSVAPLLPFSTASTCSEQYPVGSPMAAPSFDIVGWFLL